MIDWLNKQRIWIQILVKQQMVEENESYSDIELDMPPKLTFEELRQQVMKDPPLARKRLDLLRTLYYYSKDCKCNF